MSPELAKQIFDLLVDTLRAHNLTDVLAFYGDGIRSNSPDDVYLKYVEESEQPLDRLIDDARQEPRWALGRLVSAALLYFRAAHAIPGRYRSVLQEITNKSEEKVPLPEALNLRLINGEQKDITEVLEHPNITAVISLLELIRDNMESDDQQLLNALSLQ